jgi:hypothetical protein
MPPPQGGAMPPGAGRPPMQAPMQQGMPGGAAPPQMNPAMLQAAMQAQQQQRPAGMARGGRVKNFKADAAEEMPPPRKVKAVKRRKPPVAVQMTPGDDMENGDLSPGGPPSAVGAPPMGSPPPGMKKGGKWIQNAKMKKGALHKELGIAEDKKIPKKTLARAAEKGGKLGKRARLAETLSKLRKNKGGKCDKMAAGGAMKVRRGFPNVQAAPVRKFAAGGKIRGCGAATKGTRFQGIF